MSSLDDKGLDAKIFRPINLGDFSNSYKGSFKAFVDIHGGNNPDYALDYKVLTKNQ